MRKTLQSALKLALIPAFLCLSLSCFSQIDLYDVQHYDFFVKLSDRSDTVIGKAGIRMKMKKPVSNILLDFSTTIAKDKGMTVTSCTLDGRAVKFEAKENNEKINLTWEGNQPIDGEHTIVVQYTGIPTDGLIISNNVHKHRTFFADNWPNRGHKWLPCIDHPGDKATVDFTVVAPSHYKVVSNGLLQSESPEAGGSLTATHWKEVVPIATKVMVIGVADFAVELAGKVQDSIPVYSWVFPEDKVKGFYDYGQAKDVLPFFIRYVGPYGYKKLANVQSKTIFGGLENANTIFYSENSVTGTRKSESLLAHEIAHQWFGNMATEKTFAHLWLSEGFATYMTILYMEDKYGKDTAIHMLQTDREQVIKSGVTSKRSVVDETTNYMALLNTNSYQKGGWVLHMLRHELGDEVFQKAIRAYYKQYTNSNADTRDLQKVIEQVSGKNLSVFFDQWLYKPGLPDLDVKWGYGFKTNKTWIEIRQLQQNGFVFTLPVQLKVKTKNVTTNNIQVSNRYTYVEFDGEIEELLLDPATTLLFKAVTHHELAK
ncbi:M1 family metallopeptidase [Terrimonas sp. NA20]|uniref:Aminopeptidase N n=1 Tax=Terrimonas ginsenosidimutans TaxID=2908004 RepID=A0ABS9KVW3_9BACT|nr:M1 family metallopeptidase [Terrimonas ginsenosidimutans]MCG2616448.1 M1 family metallopeptidase [Terrimonas ginsenosidimutans]